jgi:4-carboxymuconolactone decarboxylase
VTAVEREALPADQQRFHDAVKAIRRRPVSGPFIVLMNSSPDLAARFAHLGHYFHSRGQADESILPLRARAFVALLGSRALDVPYEWAAWVGWALEAGVPQETADAIREGTAAPNLTTEEALVSDFCTELTSGNHRVTDATFNAALARFGTQALLELVVTLGYFTMIALPLNAFEIEMSDAQVSLRKPFAPLPVQRKSKVNPDVHREHLPMLSDGNAASPRIALLTSHADVAPEHQHYVDRILRTRGSLSNIFQVLLHSPDAAERIAHVGAFFLYESVLPAPVRTLIALIAARELDCGYIWAAHRNEFATAELGSQRVAALERGQLWENSTGQQKSVYRFCLQLLRDDHHVDEPTYRATVEHFGLAATVQIAASLGYFAMIALVANAFSVPRPDSADSRAAF